MTFILIAAIATVAIFFLSIPAVAFALMVETTRSRVPAAAALDPSEASEAVACVPEVALA